MSKRMIGRAHYHVRRDDIGALCCGRASRSRQVSMVPGYVFRREHGRHRVSRYSLKSPTIEFIVKNERRKCSNFYRVCERRQERFNASIIHARHVRVVAHVSHWRRGGNVYRSTLTERP